VSARQAAAARQRVTAAGLTGSVEIRQQDYRELRDGPFDAIISVGMRTSRQDLEERDCFSVCVRPD
jgi:cyclopropane fatty-acyl-phospholipid synthase-like methyltransferase